MTEHVIKRGDALTLQWVLNADLTGATLRWLMAKAPTGEPLHELTPTYTVTDGVTTVSVDLTSEHTADPGRFYVEVEASKPGWGPVTFPNDGYERLTITQDLG